MYSCYGHSEAPELIQSVLEKRALSDCIHCACDCRGRTEGKEVFDALKSFISHLSSAVFNI